jgi:hypothetical protein
MVCDHDDDRLVADYMGRLSAAASTLPADRRAELIDEITTHIAEARAALPASPGGPPSVPGILERLGDPAEIAQAAAEPYPGGGYPVPARPAAPASVRYAVRLMYLGAAASLAKVIVGAASESTTRSAMEASLRAGARKLGTHLTLSQLYSGITPTLVMAFVAGLVGVGLWILVARAARSGRDWARVTGLILFGLGTLALLIGPPDVGIHGPEAAVTRVFAVLVWLIGLAAVVLLWQKDSGVFFKALRPR